MKPYANKALKIMLVAACMLSGSYPHAFAGQAHLGPALMLDSAGIQNSMGRSYGVLYSRGTQQAQNMKPLLIHDRLNPEGLVLVHAVDYFPGEGVLYPNNFFGYGPAFLRNPRTIVEFSLNGVIDLWNDARYVVLIPLSAVQGMRFLNMWYSATSFFGPFEIPPGATILIVNKQTRPPAHRVKRVTEKGIGVIYSNVNDAVDAAFERLSDMGYQPMGLSVKPRQGSLGYGTSWITPDGTDLTRHDTQAWLSEELKALSRTLGVPHAAAIRAYDIGALTFLMEKMHHNFVAAESLSEGIPGERIETDLFLREAESAYHRLKIYNEAEARKFLAFARFYAELYRIQEEAQARIDDELPWGSGRFTGGLGGDQNRGKIVSTIINQRYGTQFPDDGLHRPQYREEILHLIAARFGLTDMFSPAAFPMVPGMERVSSEVPGFAATPIDSAI